jgi:hypothetical protein
MSLHEAMTRIDDQLSHVWVVRTFLKHSEEAEESDELMEVVRTLYDACLAVGPSWTAQDADGYLKTVRKKLGKLRDAAARFRQLQPHVSAHTNFKMAVQSLEAAVEEISRLADAAADGS